MAKKRTFSPPDSAEREYMRVMAQLSRALAADADRVLVPAVHGIVGAWQAETKQDAALDVLLDQAIAELARLAVVHVTQALSRLPFLLEKIDTHNERQFAAVVKSNTGHTLPPAMPGAPRSPLGVNVFRSEPFLQPLSDTWIKTNTDLIKSIPTRLNPELEGIVRRGATSGASVKTIQDQIKARYSVTASRAKLIAQDQTLKLHADLTRHRLQSVGVESYIWRNVGDSRVRPDHVEHEGKTYTWNKPPFDGHPGQPVRCRCASEAIWPDD
jgi:SPP1 gp7 family putative phage head morphogenesis protein